MAETKNQNAGEQSASPSINVLTQYIKDFSFENPNAPDSLRPQDKAPEIDLQVSVAAKPVGDSEFESELKLNGSAKNGQTVLFAFELVYAGIFRMKDIPQDQLHPVVMIECPRLLFPFARQIVADAVRNGGFPPLYMDPIDFVSLYRQQAEQAQKAAQNDNKTVN